MERKKKKKCFTIRMTGKGFQIENQYKLVCLNCKAYIDDNSGYDFAVSADREDILEEKRMGSLECQRAGINPGLDLWESLAIYRKIIRFLRKDNYIMMHGAVISTNNEGYMIAAPSGMGKTTRARIWMEQYPGSFIVNGDKPLIRVSDRGAYAWGTPWCGKEGWSRNSSVPLRAIYLLERAERDSIEAIRPKEVIKELLPQTFFPRDSEGVYDTIKLVNLMKNHVRVFRYRSTMTAESVRMAYEAAQAAGPIG